MLGECRRVFTISRTTSDRLAKYNGLRHVRCIRRRRSLSASRAGPYGDYILYVGRMESIKRPDLAVRAMLHVDRPIRLVMVGDGTQRRRTEKLAEQLGVSDRIQFAGTLDEQALVELYAGALAVVYTPFDEDYGYVTLESFLARKPVVTTPDSGGPLEFVQDGVNGIMADASPEAMAAAINQLAPIAAAPPRLGDAGFERARLVTWDGVMEKLVHGQ